MEAEEGKAGRLHHDGPESQPGVDAAQGVDHRSGIASRARHDDHHRGRDEERYDHPRDATEPRIRAATVVGVVRFGHFGKCRICVGDLARVFVGQAVRPGAGYGQRHEVVSDPILVNRTVPTPAPCQSATVGGCPAPPTAPELSRTS